MTREVNSDSDAIVANPDVTHSLLAFHHI